MSTEADIVERLQFDAIRAELLFSKGVASNIEEAAAEITKLRAERAAAARDMRERCATVVAELFQPVHTFSSENAEMYRIQDRTCELAAAKIRALPDTPTVFATDQTGGAT